MSEGSASLFEFSSRVSIGWAKNYAEMFKNDRYLHVRPRELWAFATAVEAAERYDRARCGGPLEEEAAALTALIEALSLFDFGDEDHA